MKQAMSAALALIALAAAPLLAGKRIQMESTDLTNNKTTKQEILIDATRMKVDTPENAMMFLTAGGNRMVVVDKAKKEYSVIDQATMDTMGSQVNSAMAQMEAAMKGMPPEQRAMMEQMMKGRGGMPGAAPVAAATVYAAKGSGTVNGFRCTNYEGTQGGQKVAEICAASTADASLAASDFEVMQKMREFMSKMPMVAGLARAGITENGVNGMPVQTTRFTNGKATSREDVKSIANAAFTDADFSTGDAKKVDMPGMSGRGKGR